MTLRRELIRQSFQASWPWLLLSLLALGAAVIDARMIIERDTYRYLFVVDITQSMNVRDMELGTEPASRIEFAKSAIQTALKSLPCGSEAGLAIFTEHRSFVLFTPVEICEHYRDLSDMLNQLDWRMAWASRSEVAKGLYSAVAAAEELQPDIRLVFLTDGHEAPPVNPLLRPPFSARSGAVPGFIGGIGGANPRPIPRLDQDDNIVGYWRHEDVLQVDVHSLGRPGTQQGEAMVGINMVDIARRIALGQEHLSALREHYLQELATRTGLDYIRVESTAQFSSSLIHRKYARRTPLLSDFGRVPSGFALLMLIYAFVVLPRREAARLLREPGQPGH